MHVSLIRVLVVGEIKSGTSKFGKPYTIQEVECLTLDETGDGQQVGVLTLPKELVGKATPGDYAATFSLGVDYRDRRIGARITDLRPVNIANGKVTASASAASKAGS
jgi:hypothetical protein